MAYSAGKRLAAALRLRRPEPWETNESTAGRANCEADSRCPPGRLEQFRPPGPSGADRSVARRARGHRQIDGDVPVVLAAAWQADITTMATWTVIWIER